MDEAPVTSSRTLLPVLGWGAFLGASWTWCIGMFLPVLLVRDLGLWGWVVFAVPNVIGAAAMGWVLRDSAASERIVSQHRTACAAFSVVTIAFHLFFLSIIWRMIGAAALLLFLFVVACAAAIKVRHGDWLTAAAALAISLGALAILLFGGALSLPSAESPDSHADLSSLALVGVFGFGLCPYLDLTFHRVRRSTSPATGRAAFTFGFAGPFLAMIVFTLLYGQALVGVVGLETNPPIARLLLGAVAIHMLVQSAFTIAIHAREIAPATMGKWPPAAISILAISLLAGAAAISPHRIFALDIAELGYRLFMGFYGLIFPAYVWICIVPWRKIAAPLDLRPARAVFVLAVALAAPFFALGFIARPMTWLIPGLGLVLAAPLFIPRSAHKK